MVRAQLADHIYRNLKKGYTEDSLRFSLINQGYTRITVDSAIDLANKKLSHDVPPMKERPEIVYKVVAEPTELEEIKDTTHTNKKGFFSKLFS